MKRVLLVSFLFLVGVAAAGGILDKAFLFNSGLPVFTPASLKNLEAWYDATDITSVTKDGSDRVSMLNDKSGNGRHLGQTTDANKPLWLVSAINGRSAIETDSSGRFLTVANGTKYQFEYNTPHTVLFVYRPLSGAAIMSDVQNGGLFRGIAFFQDSDKVGVEMVSTDGSNVLRVETTNDDFPVASGSFYSVMDTYDGSHVPAAHTIYKNFTSRPLTTLANNLSATIASGSPWNLGKHNYGSPFVGYYAEVVIYSRVVTSSERGQLQKYVNDKYGL